MWGLYVDYSTSPVENVYTLWFAYLLRSICKLCETNGTEFLFMLLIVVGFRSTYTDEDVSYIYAQ